MIRWQWQGPPGTAMLITLAYQSVAHSLPPLRPCPPSPPPRQVSDTQRLVRYVDDAVGRSAKAFEVQALRR